MGTLWTAVPATTCKDGSASQPWGFSMYFVGIGIFAVLAVVVVFAFIKVKKGDRAYEQGE